MLAFGFKYYPKKEQKNNKPSIPQNEKEKDKILPLTTTSPTKDTTLPQDNGKTAVPQPQDKNKAPVTDKKPDPITVEKKKEPEIPVKKADPIANEDHVCVTMIVFNLNKAETKKKTFNIIGDKRNDNLFSFIYLQSK